MINAGGILFIVFKIKPLETLQPGQIIQNEASIFFDFNAPIITNKAETIILRDDDNDGFFEDVDCDDNNNEIFPEAVEIPYNGFDDDCDPLTLDDDLDGDGFPLDEDCDDENSGINPNVIEIAYNGIDDDCDPLTLDDDLDGDGFNLGEDCDDENSDIYPGAVEIVNNGIDEDCDGEDLETTSTSFVEKGFATFYPNPVSDLLTIESESEVVVKVWSQNGTLVSERKFSSGKNQLYLDKFISGVYGIQIIGKNINVSDYLVVTKN